MSNYPSYEQAEGSKLAPRSGVRNRTATNGESRGRTTQSVTLFDPTVVHRALTLTQVQALYTFHDSVLGEEFDLYFIAEARTITCIFANPPFDVQAFLIAGGAKRYSVTSHMIQAGA